MRNLFLGLVKAMCVGSLTFCSLLTSLGQNIFTNVPIDNLLGVDLSSAGWGDYDNDGKLDFLIIGFSPPATYISELWRNSGSSFDRNQVAGLPGAFYGAVNWGDYDNDGRLDFLLTGTTNGSVRIAQLWHNTGGQFEKVPIAGLSGVAFSSVAWGDFDNDGRLDFCLTGLGTNSVPISQLWRNTGGGFNNVPVTGLPGVHSGSAAWGDYDNDGWLDLLLTGFSSTGRICQLWRNTGNGFTNVQMVGVPGVQLGGAIWGDFDGDGRLDFLVSGTTNGNASGAICQLWRNTGNGFSNFIVPNLPGVYYSSAAWADYDNDGRLDFLVTGTTNGSPSGVISQLWRNTGSSFVLVATPGVPGVDGGSVAWADYNNDGRLDLLLTGCTTVGQVSQLWRNSGATVANDPPEEPDGLRSVVSNNVVRLSWNAPGDDHTPGTALSYNLRVGTGVGRSDIVGPQASDSGFRRLPAMGNCQLRTNAVLVLPPGNYAWSVQAIDGAFAGSPFSVWQSFIVSGSVVTPPRLMNLVRLGNGMFQFSFTNTPGATFACLAATNLSTNSSSWSVIGPVPEIAPGQFQFLDPEAPNFRQRFYRVRSQ